MSSFVTFSNAALLTRHIPAGPCSNLPAPTVYSSGDTGIWSKNEVPATDWQNN